jgi:hypothetical protein
VSRNVRDDLVHMSWERQVFAIPNEGHHICACFVLKPTSLHPTQAYSSQNSSFEEPLAGVGPSELP